MRWSAWLPLLALAACGDSSPQSARAATARAVADPEAPALVAGGPAPAHPVFSLIDNRALGHVQRAGGLFIAAGSPGLARYLRFDRPRAAWRRGEEVDGLPVVWPLRAALLEVPLAPGQAAAADTLALRLHAPGPRRLSVRVNGVGGPAVDLPAGWQTLRVPLPPGALRGGENTLALDFYGKRSAAVAWIQVGGAVPAGEAAAVHHDRAADALVLPAGDGLAYYLAVPAAARLAFEVAGADCAVMVAASTHGGDELRGELRGAGELDLAALGGQVARLELTAAGCAEARLFRAELVVAGAAPTPARGEPPRYVVLWVMDTLRADRVRPFHADARPEVPTFERLARTGTVFRRAYSPGNESKASHAGMWTGLYPANHRIITVGEGWTWRLDRDFATLGEELKAAGLYTSGTTANGMVTFHAGYGRGFDVFANLMRDGLPGGEELDRMNAAIPGAKILELALASVAERTDQPFLLYLGTIDTHKPWVGHEPWLARYYPARYRGLYERSAHGGNLGIHRGTMTCTVTPVGRDLARIHALYDSDVSYQDALLGQLLDQLTAWGIADQTLLIVTADHGEELWEDGRCGHGASLRETLVHVPLLIHYPPLFPAGVIDAGVETLDLLPTLLDALGRPVPAAVQGESLLPLAHGVGGGYVRPSIASQHEYAHAMRLGRWKLRVSRHGVPDLYDLDSPAGDAAAVTDRPLEQRHVTDALALFYYHRRRWLKASWGVASNLTAAGAVALEEP